MGWIRLICRHCDQCANKGLWLNTDNQAYYCDVCKQKEIISEFQAGDGAKMTDIQFLFIPDPLPGLNDLQASRNTWRVNALKKQWYDIIGWHIKQAKLWPMKRIKINFVWIEKNKRRDPDNIAGGGRKLILDALKLYGIIPDDRWDNIAGWTDIFEIDKTAPGVKMEIFESR